MAAPFALVNVVVAVGGQFEGELRSGIGRFLYVPLLYRIDTLLGEPARLGTCFTRVGGFRW